MSWIENPDLIMFALYAVGLCGMVMFPVDDEGALG